MILRDIIQRIQSANSKGVNSDESRLSNRHIYNKLLTVRTFLLSRMIRNRKVISSWNYMTLPCVEVIEVPTNEECPCIPESGCKIYRTKYKIPKPFTDNTKHQIKTVTDLERNISISYIPLSQIKFSSGGKYTRGSIKYFIENGYMYFNCPMKLNLVKITMIPEDIFEARNFNMLCGNQEETSCVSILDTEFPIDGELLEPLIQMTYEELVTAFSQAREDADNNGVDSAVNPSRVRGVAEEPQQEQQGDE